MDKCENCGNQLLAADNVCWHCGTARTAQPAVAKAKVPEVAVEPLPFSPTAVLAYGSFTLAIFIALVFVMRSLAQQPLIAINTSRDRDRSWSVVTDSKQQFTVDLPPAWEWAEPADGDRFTELLAAYAGWETAVSPLDPASIQLIAVAPAEGSTPPRLLVVARNIQLHELSYLQIEQLIEQNGFATDEVDEATSFFGSRQIHMRLEADALYCHQQYTLEPNNSYLFSICTPPNYYLRQIRDMKAIQAGFQTLMHK